MRLAKVCMLGAFAVGKTSLVARYVRSVYSDKYLTTVGVKIDRKDVIVRGVTLGFVLWDLEGEDELHAVPTSYLRGAAGYLLVVDPTRPDTLEVAAALDARVRSEVGPLPAVLVYSKGDLESRLERHHVPPRGLVPVVTSARTGEGVEAAFLALAEQLLPP